MRARARALTVILATAGTAPAAPAAAAERPAVTIPDAVPPVEAKSFALDNGLTVTLVPFGEVPKALVLLSVRAGNVVEDGKHVWLADFTGELLELGTERLDAGEMARQTAEWGGTLGVNVGLDEMFISGTVLSDRAPDLARLVAELVQRPRLPESDVERLRADLIRQLQIMKANPGALADARLAGAVYPGQPYGRYFPTEEMLKGYTLADARGFVETYLHAGRAHLYVAGRFDAAAVEQAAREAFGGWRGGEAATRPKVKAVAKRRLHLTDRPGAVQSNVRVAAPVVLPSDPDFVTLSIMNTILGGGFSSRITRNIREQKGYTYSPSSSIDANWAAALWAERAEVKSDVTGPAIREILKEIELLAKTPPSAGELASTQTYVVGTFLLRLATRNGRVDWLRYLDRFGLPADFDFVTAVKAVTPARVTEVARRYLDPKRLTLVVVGDVKSVLPQLKGLAPLTKDK